MRSIVLDTVKKVLRRGKIRSLDEFYAVKEMIDDTTSDLTPSDRKFLSNYMGDFEGGSARFTKNRQQIH